MASTVPFLGVILLCLCLTSYSLYFDPSGQIEQAHDYLRFADVNRHCHSVLSSAKELTYDSYLPTRLKRELSFEKGDWCQDAGHAPLLPFDSSDAPRKGARRLPDPLSLATLAITHVEDSDEHRPRAAVNVSGILALTVSRKSPVPEFGPYPSLSGASPEFNISAGRTRLKIVFEGVYTESAKGDGERVLCMVGSALLPKRSGGDGQWGWAKNSSRSSFQPPVTVDSNILLVLRYPKELTLTTRAVLGTMGSMSSTSDTAYFDTVEVAAGLTQSNFMYQFRPQEPVAGAVDAVIPSNIDAAGDVVSIRTREDLYNGSNPCDVLRRYAHGGQVLTVLPGWQCNSKTTTRTTGASCQGLGPFDMGEAVDADELAGASIIIQDLQCQQQHGYDMAVKAGTAMVSVVFRVLSPWEDWGTAMSRSGPSGKTLSAEGVWNTSIGQACMVACRGMAVDKVCQFRVCLYVPTTISITRRDTMLGRITGVDATGGAAQAPLLSFQQRMHPPRIWNYHADDGPPLLSYRYSYTKIKRAGELRRRSESLSDLRKIIVKSLPLSYPRRDGTGHDRRSLSSLADTLTLCFMTVPSLFRLHERIVHPILHLEVFFLEQIIDRYVGARYRDASSGIPREEPGSDGYPLLNVSAELTVFEDHRVSRSVMTLEGIYSPADGRMYLIGCRDVRLPQGNSPRNLELEEGMDCSIEAKVEYPPTTMHWFIMSTAKVQIASTRTAVDPLHFDTLKLRVLPVLYQKPQPDGFYRGIVDGVLCAVLLSAAIAAALSQLRYLNSHADVAPYISLVMLGVQAIGYSMPLVTGVEALLAKVTLRFTSDVAMAPSSGGTPYHIFNKSWLCQSIDQVVKVLTLGTFVLTLQLGQKVRQSRARMLARSPLDPARVPRDAGKVFVYHYGIHLALFMLILALNRQAVTVEQQAALMQDLFLLPQVIGNAVWRVNCRPLRGSFYAGVTASRLLPHVYDFVRTPVVVGAYYSSEQVFVDAAASSGRLFARAGDVVVPLAAIALALVVHAQQRWNYAFVSRMGMPEQKKLQHVF